MIKRIKAQSFCPFTNKLFLLAELPLPRKNSNTTFLFNYSRLSKKVTNNHKTETKYYKTTTNALFLKQTTIFKLE